jgi:hypothetical protein
MASRIKMGPKEGMVGDMKVSEYQMKPNVPNSANDMLQDPMQTRSQLGMMPSLGDPMKDYKSY